MKMTNSEDVHLILMRNENIIDKNIYNEVYKKYKAIMKELKNLNNIKTCEIKNKYDETLSQEVNQVYEKFKNEMDEICSNTYELVDYLIEIFYVKFPSSNKDLLWSVYGEYIYQNIKDKNQNPVLFPLPDKEGEIEYLSQKFSLKEVAL
jgi:hypothetical protein